MTSMRPRLSFRDRLYITWLIATCVSLIASTRYWWTAS